MKREKVTRATMQPLQIQREGLVIFNMVVRWWWVDGEGKRVKRVKLKTTVVVKVKVPTAMVQQLNWRLLLVTKECLVKRVGNWKSTCALFGLNVDPTQKASAHSFMLLSWISNSPGTGNWINEWKNIIVFLKFLVFVQSLAIAMSAGPCFCTGTKVCSSMYLVHAMY